MVDAVAYEFAQTEEFLQIAEKLTCAYMWTRYDVLCLPPSFPVCALLGERAKFNAVYYYYY